MSNVIEFQEYHCHILPDDWFWVGAIANQDGYCGHSYVANVASDLSGQLWTFAKSGRFRITHQFFFLKKISDFALIGAPYQFSPITPFCE